MDQMCKDFEKERSGFGEQVIELNERSESTKKRNLALQKKDLILVRIVEESNRANL